MYGLHVVDKMNRKVRHFIFVLNTLFSKTDCKIVYRITVIEVFHVLFQIIWLTKV